MSAADEIAKLVGVSSRGRRLYEWRRGNGQRFGAQRLAENACAFRVDAIARGEVLQPPAAPVTPPSLPAPKDPDDRSLYVFVVATGECCVSEISACRTMARLEAGFPWFNAEGREVRP